MNPSRPTQPPKPITVDLMKELKRYVRANIAERHFRNRVVETTAPPSRESRDR